MTALWYLGALLIGPAHAQTFNLISTPSPLLLPMAFPKIQTWQHPKGAKVYFVERPELPMVDIRLVFDAGAARDTISGVAALTNSMLEGGTASLSAAAIAEAFEREGALLQTASLRDMAIVDLRSLSDPAHLNPAIDTLRQIVSESVFPKPDFERMRNQLLMAIRQSQESPEYQLERSFYRTLYKGHPYENPPLGESGTLSKIQREDVLSFYKAHYVAAGLTIAIVGAIPQKKAKAIVDALLASLPDGKKPGPLPAVPLLARPVQVAIPFASTQTHVEIGVPTLARQNRDYFALSLANQILGGSGLVSVLHEALREKQGLTYAVDSMVVPMHQSGPFAIRFQTRNLQAKRATQTVLNELQKFIDEGPTEAQLQLAKNQMIGSMPFSVASNQALINELAMMGFYRLKPDYLREYYQAVLALNKEQVKTVFKKYVSLTGLVVVTVGPQSALPGNITAVAMQR